MVRESSDLHALEPEDFLAEVHSFEHWFKAVEGYMSNLSFGRRSDLDEGELEASERDRLISILCNYAVAESAALEASSGLIRIAPNHHAKVFLATQVADEGRHLEVILHRLGDLGVANPEQEVERRASQSIREFKAKLIDLVEKKDWEAAIFAQNVVLEAMEYTVFQAHAQQADPVTRDLLERMVRDERRHIGFGENELGRQLARQPRLRDRIRRVKAELDPLVLWTFEETMDRIGVPRDQRPLLGRNYLQAVKRLGFS